MNGQLRRCGPCRSQNLCDQGELWAVGAKGSRTPQPHPPHPQGALDMWQPAHEPASPW